MINVAIAGQDRMLLDGLAAWIAGVQDLRAVVVDTDVDEVVVHGPAGIDVVVVDVGSLPGLEGAAAAWRLVVGGFRVIALGAPTDLALLAGICAAGVHGCLTRSQDLDMLAEKIRSVAAGGSGCKHTQDRRPSHPHLSPKEAAVLLAYASGMTLKAAAHHVGIRPGTAKTYLERVKAKYQEIGRPVYTKIDLLNVARENGQAGTAPDCLAAD